MRWLIKTRIRLDGIERLFVGTGNYPCDIAEYRGSLDESALALAYRELGDRYPALSAKIIVDEAICDFHRISENDDRLKFIDGDSLTLQRETRELREQDCDGSRLITVRTGSGSGFVALCVNHALFDFPSFGFLYNKLWEIYTNIRTARKGSWAATSSFTPTLPMSPERLIIDRWRGRPCTVPNARVTSLEGTQRRRVIQSIAEFDSVETLRLIATARRHGMSVHALVCAAILITLRDHSTHGGEETMVCRSAVNLRNRISPKVGEAETTVLQGFHHADAKVPFRANLYKVGRDIKKQLDLDIANSSLEMIWDRVSYPSNSILEKRIVRVTVTNWGVLQTLDQPPELRLIDRMKGWNQNEYVSWIGRNPVYVLGTYEGRLKIIGMYASSDFTDAEVDDFKTAILRCLRGVR